MVGQDRHLYVQVTSCVYGHVTSHGTNGHLGDLTSSLRKLPKELH